MSRSTVEPILSAIPAARQEDARHYGVHPYFTRRPANVVRTYVERYSREGDVVLDPFGGTGVTAIEAFLLGRHAVHNDLNPFANFIASNIADTTLASTAPLRAAFERVEAECAGTIGEIERDPTTAKRLLERLPLPENITLPRTADVEFFYDLFSPQQLAGLALLKRAILRVPPGIVRDLLLLAWSASIAKLNKTFLSAKGRAASRGGSSIFSIYRYKVAAQEVALPIWETFEGRFRNVLAAKEEVIQLRKYREQQSRGAKTIDSRKDFRVMAHDAAELDRFLPAESVDYVFTDPPYGAFISYLDLSVLWNHWLGFPVNDAARRCETIVGGERGHSEDHYKESLARSLRTSFKLLRPDRWLSIVFQHWDLSYFSTILETATSCGAELRTAITQTGDVIWSMHKKKNSASVIAGEMILTFYKSKRPAKSHDSPAVADQRDPGLILGDVFDACLSNGGQTFTNEALFNRLVVELWNRRSLRCLSLDRRTFAQELERRGWTYSPRTHLWTRNDATFGARGRQSLFEE